MLEGEAVHELLMVNTRIRLMPRPAQDPHRRRLSSGARRNLPRQTIEMQLGLAPSADCFRHVQSAEVDHGPSPPAFPTNERGWPVIFDVTRVNDDKAEPAATSILLTGDKEATPMVAWLSVTINDRHDLGHTSVFAR